MLKKLAGGEYSLKITFWAFGLLGFLLFNILTNITHSGVLRIICPYGRLCSVNIVLYIFNNSVRLMTGSNDSVMTYLVCHLILAACFVCYMIVVLRGLWKSADAYEGKKFWPFCAKFLTVCLVLISLKSIF
jgi:hypothetical protein